MSGELERHAEAELRKAGFFDKDSAYGGRLGPTVMKMVKVFADEEHSGMSGATVLSIFNRVARFKTLTPLTDDPDEWMEVDDGKTWQSRRQASCFSNDGGKTFYDIDANDNRAIRNTEAAAKS